LDGAVVLLPGIDHDRVVGGVGSDPDVLEQALWDSAAGAGRGVAGSVDIGFLAVRKCVEGGRDRRGGAVGDSAGLAARRCAPPGAGISDLRAAAERVETGFGGDRTGRRRTGFYIAAAGPRPA